VKNLKSIMVFLMVGVLAVGFFSSCKAASTSYTDAEKAVLINKAIQGGGTTARSEGTISGREVTGGGIAVAFGSTDDFVGSQFKTEIDSWVGISSFYTLTYTNLAVTVTDENDNPVTVVLNGSIAYGYKMAADGSSMTMVVFGTVTGTVGEDPFNFDIDLKSDVTVSGSTTTLILTGTAGGITINQTYSYSTTT